MSKARIQIISWDQYPDQTITFAVDGRRYVYALPNITVLDTILYLARRVTIGKAFAHAKRIGRLV